jgi:hypothetical protein
MFKFLGEIFVTFMSEMLKKYSKGTIESKSMAAHLEYRFRIELRSKISFPVLPLKLEFNSITVSNINKTSIDLKNK